MSSILSLPITKVSQLIKNKTLSTSELCVMCLDRINKTKNLNAFITVTKETAYKQSAESEKRISEGKSLSILDGIPIAFKDNWSTKNIRTTCASKMLSDYTPPYNATAVQKLKDGGATIVGKTNLDEFAMGSATINSYFGPTKNPYQSGLKYKSKRNSKLTDAEGSSICKSSLNESDFLIAGGSSGGAAVAVAAGMCFGSIGSDTGGSTRLPASLCGVIGLKPTYGLISRHGLIPLCNSLDVPGILTRSVDDATVLLNHLAGPDNMDSTTVNKNYLPFTIPDEIDIKKFHIGIPKEYECPGMSSEIIETWRTVANLLENAGARVSSVSLPHTKYSIMCYSVISCCEIASNFARYDGIRYGHRAKSNSTNEHHYAITRREGFSDVVRERILAGNYFLLRDNYEKYFHQATKVRRLIYNDFSSVFENSIDLLLTPVSLNEAVPYSKWTLIDERQHSAIEDFCTQPVNMAGLPAVSLPIKLSNNGLPLSLQLIGKPFQEQQMLMAAKWLEQHMNFPVLDIDL